MTSPLKLIVFAVLVVAAAAAMMTQVDPDLWGHTRFGLDVLATGRLSATDPYSFTQDRVWINHEWLAEVQMGLAFALGGAAGLVLLKAALVLTAISLVWVALGSVSLQARLPIFAGAVVGLYPLLQTLRPQLWTVVCMALLCLALRDHVDRRAWTLPLLFAAWANLHGGWILGLGVLGLWCGVGAWLNEQPRGRAVLLVLVSCLATLATPYGWNLWWFLADTVRLERPQIEEWQSLLAVAPNTAVVWLATMTLAVLVARHPFRSRWQSIAVVALLAVLGLRVARIAPLFVEVSAILLAPALAQRWPRAGRDLPKPSRHDGLVAAVVFTLSLVIALPLGRDAVGCVRIDERSELDAEVVARLSQAPPGRLVTFFDWGQYAIWHFGPEIRVSMDGRRETVYTNTRLREHDAIVVGTEEGVQTLQRWNPEFVWLPASSTQTRSWLLANGYRLEVDSPTSFLAVRDDLPALPSSERVGVDPGCFPG